MLTPCWLAIAVEARRICVGMRKIYPLDTIFADACEHPVEMRLHCERYVGLNMTRQLACMLSNAMYAYMIAYIAVCEYMWVLKTRTGHAY